AELGARPAYKLCRCGQSKKKPYCDNTHARVDFDGTESAPLEPSADRQRRVGAEGVTVIDDGLLCTRAGFCGSKVGNIWKDLERAGDSRVRFDVIQRIERCPSGRLAYDVGTGTIEPICRARWPSRKTARTGSRAASRSRSPTAGRSRPATASSCAAAASRRS